MHMIHGMNLEIVSEGIETEEQYLKIDEMGILALYSEIDILQREDRIVTVTDVKNIIDDAKQNSYRIKIFAMDENQKSVMEQHFGNLFEIVADRDTFDYIYKTEDLSNLPGKNYQKKRNHCSRFERDNPEYTFNIINAEISKKRIEFGLPVDEKE